MNYSDKQIEKYISDARSEDLMSSHSIEKHCFESLLSGMIVKTLSSKSSEAEKQLESLQRMERFLDRLTYMNVIYILQTKLLRENERQLLIIEQKNKDLLEENINLKKNIK